MNIKQTDTEVYKMSETAYLEATGKNTKYKGMTYEEGIRDALAWVLGEISTYEMKATLRGEA